MTSSTVHEVPFVHLRPTIWHNKPFIQTTTITVARQKSRRADQQSLRHTLTCAR